MSGSSTATTAHPSRNDEHDEPQRSRLTKLADRIEVEDEEGGVERKAGKEERREDDERDDEVEEDNTVNRYKPITVPFHKQRPAPSTSTSSPYPPRSAASIITRPASSERHNLLFFQLPTHLPLHPSTAPSVASASLASSSASLPPKPPTLATSTPSTTSSFLAQKTLLQKKKLLTFDPQFANSLQYVQPGLIGRLLVYRSGRVRMEVGGVRLDVQRGVDCLYHQQVVSVHAEVVDGAEGKEAEAPEATAEAGENSGGGGGRREWVELGDVRERLVCTMDVNDLQRKRDSRVIGSDRRTDERNDDKTVGNDVKMKEEKV